jgi:phosphotriesterase-related protein
MAKINGVLGPFDTAELGFTLMHEHVLTINPAMRHAFPGWLDRAAHVKRAVAEVRSAKERGVATIVDLTPINLGRDIGLIREVAEKAGMQMIAATGFYWTEEPWFQGWDVDRLVEVLVRDITHGIEGSDIKAGIIKCATDHLGVTELNQKLLRVAARLHRATGVPISTHTDPHIKVGLVQQDVFAEEGVDLSRVVIGHCGDTTNAEYLEEIAKRGSFLGMDRFGLDMMLSGPERVSIVAEMCRRGYANQLVLSHDHCCHIDWFPPEALETMREAVAPNWNFRHVSDNVIPALRKEGVPQAQIDAMTIGNPRRIFERQGSY